MRKEEFIYNVSYFIIDAMSHPNEETVVWSSLKFHLDDVVWLSYMDDDQCAISSVQELYQRLQYRFRNVSKWENVLKRCTPKIATPKRYERKVIEGYKRVYDWYKNNISPLRLYRKIMYFLYRLGMLYERRDEHSMNYFTWEKVGGSVDKHME